MQKDNSMNQQERAQAFHALHHEASPLVLYNIWDAGSAKEIESIGAKAIATGSWAVAAAHGFADREAFPLERVLMNLQEIVASISLPLTLDFEGGYGKSADELKKTIGLVLQYGAVGINFEDQVVGGEGLYSIEEQSQRIRAVRQAAESASVNLFINARTDIFLKLPAEEHNEAKVSEALERAKAYAEAGASGFFAPGLRDAALIRTLVESSPLPVNIMMMGGVPSPKELAGLGVRRISYGGMPFRVAMEALKEAGRKALDLE
jgi:2-methylisocitrate lyase-like PEP mutase family enzyme